MGLAAFLVVAWNTFVSRDVDPWPIIDPERGFGCYSNPAASTIFLSEEGLSVPIDMIEDLDYEIAVDGKAPNYIALRVFGPLDLVPYKGGYVFFVAPRKGVNRGNFQDLEYPRPAADEQLEHAKLNSFSFLAIDGRKLRFERLTEAECDRQLAEIVQSEVPLDLAN